MAAHRCGPAPLPAPLAPRHAPRLQASAHIGSTRAPTPAQPALLDAWEQLADGRYAGTAEGRPVWLTVSLEGRLPSDPREALTLTLGPNPNPTLTKP